jgi:hypothetical protein
MPRPSLPLLLLLFTGVRGIGILRTSPLLSSSKFAKKVVINSSFGGCTPTSLSGILLLMVGLLYREGR